MGKWVLYTQSNYAHPKPTHLTPLDNTVPSEGLHHSLTPYCLFSCQPSLRLRVWNPKKEIDPLKDMEYTLIPNGWREQLRSHWSVLKPLLLRQNSIVGREVDQDSPFYSPTNPTV